MDKRPWIVGATRTGLAPLGGVLKDIRCEDLALQCAQHLLQSLRIGGEVLSDIILGCGVQEGEQGFNLARQVALLAGWRGLPGLTLNRMDNGGLESVLWGHRQLCSEEGLILAGACEKMTHSSRAYRTPHPVGLSENSQDHLPLVMAAKTMFTASKASRASLDEIVLRSHRRAVRAQDQDVFQSEICPLTWEETNLSEEGKRSIKCRLSSDENPREDLSTERLKNVQGLFQDSVMSAAHLASGADGAGFVLMASEQMARKNKWPCLAKVVSSCVEAKSPAERGQDLWSTAERALQSARWKASDLDVIQVSEASVAQVLGFLNDFPGDAEVVNPNGGHLAYGHAMAAASATDTVMLLHEMNRKKAKKGMVVSDASGGQQMAVCFERVQA